MVACPCGVHDVIHVKAALVNHILVVIEQDGASLAQRHQNLFRY